MHQLKIPNSDFSGIFTTQGLSYFATWLIGSVLRVAECSLTLSLLRHLGFGPISHEAHLEGGGPLRLRWFVGPQDQKASFPLTRVPFWRPRLELPFRPAIRRGSGGGGSRVGFPWERQEGGREGGRSSLAGRLQWRWQLWGGRGGGSSFRLSRVLPLPPVWPIVRGSSASKPRSSCFRADRSLFAGSHGYILLWKWS